MQGRLLVVFLAVRDGNQLSLAPSVDQAAAPTVDTLCVSWHDDRNDLRKLLQALRLCTGGVVGHQAALVHELYPADVGDVEGLAGQPSDVADAQPVVVDGEGRELEAPGLVLVLEDEDVRKLAVLWRGSGQLLCAHAGFGLADVAVAVDPRGRQVVAVAATAAGGAGAVGVEVSSVAVGVVGGGGRGRGVVRGGGIEVVVEGDVPEAASPVAAAGGHDDS